MPHERLVIISPVRNEGRHLGQVLSAVTAQTRPPDEWIVVNDGSTDDTRKLLDEAAARIPFLRVIDAPSAPLTASADRLAHAAAPRAFNVGLRLGGDFTHVGKLDGDIELPQDYFERLLTHFRSTPQLGIAGGIVVEPRADGWRVHGASHLEHVRGALRLYSRECFEAIGGVREVLGWDGIDVVLARMHGYTTRSFPDLVARHHRPTGTAQGRLKGHVRWGRCMYIQGYPAYWVSARAAKVSASSPRFISGAAYLVGYAHAAMRRVPRFEEPGYRAHLRRELRHRATARVLRRHSAPAARPTWQPPTVGADAAPAVVSMQHERAD